MSDASRLILVSSDDDTDKLGLQTVGTIQTVPVTLWDANGNRTTPTSGFVTRAFDYVSLALTNSATETYTYKTGGSGGTTVATVTVVYTDSTKTQFSTITKT